MQFEGYVYSATAIILLLEVVFGRHKGIYDKHTTLVTIGCVSTNAALRPLSALLLAYLIGAIVPTFRNSLQEYDNFSAFVLLFVATEFFFYWAHRWAHEAKKWKNPWLWKLHRTHHSAKFINVGITIRVNAFWTFVVPTSWTLAVAIYLGLYSAATATILTIYGWNLITHCHFRWDDSVRQHRFFGPAFRTLEHIFVSPGMHHSHHGYGRDGGNFRNYAVTLAVFDWIFGTLYIPKGRPFRYGIPGPDVHWAEEVFYPLIQIHEKVDSGLSNKKIKT